ncbi:hypothetical protein TNCT_260422 [Trichonephila clavata]|uniref:Uncharacterized protein n=1 Tax=Trichonephila clavata TaxID=2740835 RepID=A0A8X6GIC2_TRICU|nr:hypothetical protein TNCT_260422 [Trichonephila clavata]
MRIIRKELEEARLGVSQQTELSSSSVAERELTASEPDVAEQTWNIRLGLGNSEWGLLRSEPFGNLRLASRAAGKTRRVLQDPWHKS